MPFKFNRWFFFLTLSIANSFGSSGSKSRDVGDFAPLEINNKWKYRGQYVRGWMTTNDYSDSSLRTIEVDSLRNFGDSTIYYLTFTDSLYKRQDLKSGILLSDTVSETWVFLVELNDGTLRSNGFTGSVNTISIFPTEFFYKNTVSEAEISGVFISNKGTHKITRNWQAVYAEGIGLLTMDAFYGNRSYWTVSYELIEFNGMSISNARSVSLFKESRQRSSPLKRIHRQGSKILVNSQDSRNMMGRKLP